MEKTMLGAVASLGVALGALGQGNFGLDNSAIPNGLTLDAPGQWYNGAFGMEVWVLKDTDVPAGINLAAAPGSGVLGYNAMEADGFLKEATYVNQQTIAPGTFNLGPVFMPDAHSGGTVVLALAAWNTSAPSWSAMLASANQATRAGVVAFDQPTVPTLLNPESPPFLTMDRDLVLTAIPEPRVLALVVVGGLLPALVTYRAKWRDDSTVRWMMKKEMRL